NILKGSIALIAIESIATRMPSIQLSYSVGSILVEYPLPGDPLAGCFPHAWDVDILVAVVIEIGPCASHSCADAFDMRLFRSNGERSIAVVAVKLRASKVIGYKKVRQSIACQIAPCAREAVAIVIYV